MSGAEIELWKESLAVAAQGLAGDRDGIFFCWDWHDELVEHGEEPKSRN